MRAREERKKSNNIFCTDSKSKRDNHVISVCAGASNEPFYIETVGSNTVSAKFETVSV